MKNWPRLETIKSRKCALCLVERITMYIHLSGLVCSGMLGDMRNGTIDKTYRMSKPVESRGLSKS